jgi:hypothetical protein
MEEQSMKYYKPSQKQIGGNHYKDMKISVSEYVYSNKIDWYAGNAIKYLSRYNKKNKDLAKQIEDLNKSVHYIQLLIEKISK